MPNTCDLPSIGNTFEVRIDVFASCLSVVIEMKTADCFVLTLFKGNKNINLCCYKSVNTQNRYDRHSLNDTSNNHST